MSNCLGVFGLSLYTTERELEKEFSKFGPLEKVQVVLDGKVSWWIIIQKLWKCIIMNKICRIVHLLNSQVGICSIKTRLYGQKQAKE